MIPATSQPNGNANPLVKNMQEPAPEQQPDETAPVAVSSLWQRMRNNFTLNLTQDNPRIDAQRAWFANHQAYLNRVAIRAKRYLYYIVGQTEKRHMPSELALLPIVESAYDPFAYSHDGASGPWQFIPSTAEHFGLKQNWWYDGRRDIVASTNAALDYLQELANRFNGNWLLALASYNAGAGTVQRAIDYNKRHGRPTDFWDLKLPEETSAYVPKLLAIAQLVAQPDQYGVTLPKIPNQPYFVSVDTGGQLDLSQAAQMADVPMQELYMLNPGFNRWAMPPKGPYKLLLPVQHKKVFESALAALPDDQRITWTRYTIHSGDNLISIARNHGVPVAALRSVNHLQDNTIIAGHTLLIPEAPHGNARVYEAALRHTLRIHHQPGSNMQVAYRVTPGDSLWTIARQHHVSVQDLERWNHISRHTLLHPGQSLVLWTHGSLLAGNTTRKVRYSVHNGDSLYAIANRFNVSINAIQRWNNIKQSSYLHPGQHLTLYVDVRNVD